MWMVSVFISGEEVSIFLQLFASGGGGCCDCGDPEAWTSGVYCDLHEPVQGSEQEVGIFDIFPFIGLVEYISIATA